MRCAPLSRQRVAAAATPSSGGSDGGVSDGASKPELEQKSREKRWAGPQFFLEGIGGFCACLVPAH